jgi:hypothetical protein
MKRGEEKPLLVLHSQNRRAEKGMFGGFNRTGSRYPDNPRSAPLVQLSQTDNDSRTPVQPDVGT